MFLLMMLRLGEPPTAIRRLQTDSNSDLSSQMIGTRKASTRDNKSLFVQECGR